MPYLDGLPPAALVTSTDIVAIDQGGKPGIPGTATTRKATVSQILVGQPIGGASVASVALLRASTVLTLAAGLVYVTGYYPGTTIGGGVFLVSLDTTSADNGGTIIVDASGRRWYREKTDGQPISILEYGAVSGESDSSVKINHALANEAAISFPPGFTFNILSQLNVPTTCWRIDGQGAIISGPGTDISGGTPGNLVDGFVFTHFNQDGSLIDPNPAIYNLPNFKNLRSCVVLNDAAFINVTVGNVIFCTNAFQLNAVGTGLHSYLVEVQLSHCTVELTTATYDIHINTSSTLGMQGCSFTGFYSASNQYWIKYNFDTTGVVVINNSFECVVVDGNNPPANPAYSIYANLLAPGNGNNHYSVPGGFVNFSLANHILNIEGPPGGVNVIEAQSFQGVDPDIMGWDGFAPAGPRTTADGGGAGLIVHISPTGNDTTGHGSAVAPYLTIAGALSHIQNVDLMATSVTIQLANGTYAGAATYRPIGGADCRSIINIAGNIASPGSVILTGGITVAESGAYVVLSGMTITNLGVVSGSNATVVIGQKVVIGQMNAGVAQLTAANGGQIIIASNYTVSGGGLSHITVQDAGQIALPAPAVATFSGTPAYTGATVTGVRCGTANLIGWTFSGAVTGIRYAVAFGGGVDTGTTTPNTTIPGNVNGTNNGGWAN